DFIIHNQEQDGAIKFLTNGVGDDLILTLTPSAVIGEGPLYLREQANEYDDSPGYGQIWVKNTTPCELWFTNDAGTDIKLS
ncbi:MAG: hypothetical protein ABIH23_15575, partial [bacterium]